MQITTIACPLDLTDSNINPDVAPIWTDGVTDYRVVSGILEGEYTTSDPIPAQADRVNVVVDMDGLSALAAMGLKVKYVEDASVDP